MHDTVVHTLGYAKCGDEGDDTDVAITDIPSAFLMQEICVRHTVSNVSPCQAYIFWCLEEVHRMRQTSRKTCQALNRNTFLKPLQNLSVAFVATYYALLRM